MGSEAYRLEPSPPSYLCRLTSALRPSPVPCPPPRDVAGTLTLSAASSRVGPSAKGTARDPEEVRLTLQTTAPGSRLDPPATFMEEGRNAAKW